jgi:MOSC domain-containing protein YiiM
MAEPRVQRLFRCLVHRFPMEEIETAELVSDRGVKGCIHARPGAKRQVLLMDAETLEALGLVPGSVKENVTTSGLDLQQISLGLRLRIGESLLEASMPCEPCERMEEIRKGLRAELRGRRGWLFRIVEGGIIKRGDRIEVVGEIHSPTAE